MGLCRIFTIFTGFLWNFAEICKIPVKSHEYPVKNWRGLTAKGAFENVTSV